MHESDVTNVFNILFLLKILNDPLVNLIAYVHVILALYENLNLPRENATLLQNMLTTLT